MRRSRPNCKGGDGHSRSIGDFLKGRRLRIWRSGIRAQDMVAARANLLRVRKSFPSVANVGNKGYSWRPGFAGRPPVPGFYWAVAIRHNAVGLDFRESQAQLLLVECSDAAHKWLAERETRMLRMGAAKRWSVFGVAVARYTNRAGRAALLYASFGAGEQRFGHALAR